ncbi:MAG: MbnH family di-heme enzyme [Myxococcota bacterium]|nr:MbnH family di-heme enzyme [Myxococcota bacterium]
MIPKYQTAILVLFASIQWGCGDDRDSDEAVRPDSAETQNTGNEIALESLALPADFPTPNVPEDNVPTDEKIELGRYLFYDTKLSGNQTYSCGTCHQQALAFTDGRPVAVGSTSDRHHLGSMSLVNAAYAATLGWANPTLTTLEQQALVPMFGEEPVELGLSAITEEELLDRFREDDRYQEMFATAFPTDDDPITVGNIARAIATFERTIISNDSPYDRYQAGDREAMSDSAVRGMDLFFSEKVECFHCHGGFNFSDSIASADLPFAEKPFHNNGMYNLEGQGAYPDSQGIFDLTGEREHRGKFKAPTLRNIQVTAPYLHDGSVASLEELVDLYAAGGRTITEGPYEGDGTQHPNKSVFIVGFELSKQEKADLVAFLEALTDETLLTNPAFKNPFDDDED